MRTVCTCTDAKVAGAFFLQPAALRLEHRLREAKWPVPVFGGHSQISEKGPCRELMVCLSSCFPAL